MTPSFITDEKEVFRPSHEPLSISSSELMIQSVIRCHAHPALSLMPDIIKLQIARCVLPQFFFISASIASLKTSYPTFWFSTLQHKRVRDQIAILELSASEVLLLENMILTKVVPFLQPRTLWQFPTPEPLRMMSLMILVNLLLEIDINTIASNYHIEVGFPIVSLDFIYCKNNDRIRKTISCIYDVCLFKL